MTPQVSVLMAVYNGRRWIGEAVESVLRQSLTDLELVLVDDGSADGSLDALPSGSAPGARLVIVRQPHAGLTRALIRGIGYCRAPLIARLDADDVAMRDRLERQVEYMSAHPEVGLLATAAIEITTTCGAEMRRVISPPTGDAAIRRELIRRNPIVHSSGMFRRSAYDAAGGYNASYAVAQDYDLWLRMAGVTRLAALASPLVVRRIHPSSITATRDSERLRGEVRARWAAIRRGTYSRWSARHVLRPAMALALPTQVRRALRSVLAS